MARRRDVRGPRVHRRTGDGGLTGWPRTIGGMPASAAAAAGIPPASAAGHFVVGPSVATEAAALDEPVRAPAAGLASGAAGRPTGGSPGVRPRTRGNCPTIPDARPRGLPPTPEIPWPQVDATPFIGPHTGSGSPSSHPTVRGGAGGRPRCTARAPRTRGALGQLAAPAGGRSGGIIHRNGGGGGGGAPRVRNGPRRRGNGSSV